MKIAVIWFPGNNCEEETARAIESVGMKAEIIRWNDYDKKLDKYDGYVVPGGWAYEDRIRAGVIAAKDSVMNIIREEAKKGKPVLGICNGAQVLVESGMIPGLKEEIEIALAPNKNPIINGYYCTWVRIKNTARKNAFNMFLKDEIILLPVAHAEGRFATRDKKLLDKLKENNQIAFRYCDEKGDFAEEFPVNPNGSIHNIAAITNKEGNVMSIMPHPERATWKKQIPGFKGTFEEAEGPALGRKIFESMKRYIEENV